MTTNAIKLSTQLFYERIRHDGLSKTAAAKLALMASQCMTQGIEQDQAGRVGNIDELLRYTKKADHGSN